MILSWSVATAANARRQTARLNSGSRIHTSTNLKVDHPLDGRRLVVPYLDLELLVCLIGLQFLELFSSPHEQTLRPPDSSILGADETESSHHRSRRQCDVSRLLKLQKFTFVQSDGPIAAVHCTQTPRH